ncbi:MAG: hypothetical protein WD397_09760 [Wenzhouxiangellaceae bacterium]
MIAPTNRFLPTALPRAWLKVTCVAATAILLAACASAPVTDRPTATATPTVAESLAPPQARTELFGEPAAVPEFSELMKLSDTQREAFSEYFNDPDQADEKPHMRVVAFLEDRLGQARFHHETLGAERTLASGQGNCMSLALATAALAELGGVQVDWQITRSNPVYSAAGGLIYSANHIHTKLYDPSYRNDPGSLTLVRPHVLVDYFSNRVPLAGSTLKTHKVIGLTYQNLAAEALADGNVQRAFWLTREGLAHDAGNADLYNTMGLLHQRIGARDSAEQFFRYALEVFEDRLVILRNYQRLLVDAGNDRDARAVEQRILALPDPDPYPILELGDKALNEGHPRRALEFYDQARRTAPYLHEVYRRLAAAHLALGDRAASSNAIAMALERAGAVDDIKRYKVKARALADETTF